MKKLYIPADESELVFLKSFLDAEGIPYYVLNDNFGSVYPGVYMKGLNAKTIMVPEELFDEAKELIKSAVEGAKFEDEKKDEPDDAGPGSLADFLSFKWLFPNNRKDRK